MIKDAKQFSVLESLNMIIAQSQCKGEYTPELTELIKSIITKPRGKKLKKQTLAFVCSTRTLYEFSKTEMIDINHPGNRKFVWKIIRAIQFLTSWIKEENKYDPIFALSITKSGQPILRALDGNNRTWTIIMCFSGCEELHKFLGMLPQTFRGILRVGYTDEENKNLTANCNNYEKQTHGEIMNVTPGSHVNAARKYIESSSGLYAHKGDVYPYVKIKPTRFKHLEFQLKRLYYVNARKYKNQDLPNNIFDIRDMLMYDLLHPEADHDLKFYDRKILDGVIEIQSCTPKFRLDDTHISWATTMFILMEKENKLIKNYNKFVSSLILKIDEIYKIKPKSEKSDTKKLLKTNLSHHFKGEQKNVIQFLTKDIKNNPKKYGL